jgi:hypothetical protein
MFLRRQDFGDVAVHKYTSKQYNDTGLTPPWSNIAAHFSLTKRRAGYLIRLRQNIELWIRDKEFNIKCGKKGNR